MLAVWVAWALLAAGLWGSADFLGGLASRRTTALRVLAVGMPFGLLIALTLVLIRGTAPVAASLGWGVASGLVGGAGLMLLYSALGRGPMNVVAPMSAVTSAAVPVFFGIATGERPSGWAYLGMAVAGLAVVLISREPSEPIEPTPVADRRAVVSAALAGSLLGLGLVLLDRAGDGLWSVTANRVGATSVVVLALIVAHAVGRPGMGRLPRSATPLALGSGGFDVCAMVGYLAALESGQLAVVGVIVALYPGSTVLLARVFLHEQLHRAQGVGLALAGVGVTLLALGG